MKRGRNREKTTGFFSNLIPDGIFNRKITRPRIVPRCTSFASLPVLAEAMNSEDSRLLVSHVFDIRYSKNTVIDPELPRRVRGKLVRHSGAMVEGQKVQNGPGIKKASGPGGGVFTSEKFRHRRSPTAIAPPGSSRPAMIRTTPRSARQIVLPTDLFLRREKGGFWGT